MDRERKVSEVGENNSSRFSVPESGSHFVASPLFDIAHPALTPIVQLSSPVLNSRMFLGPHPRPFFCAFRGELLRAMHVSLLLDCRLIQRRHRGTKIQGV